MGLQGNSGRPDAAGGCLIWGYYLGNAKYQEAAGRARASSENDFYFFLAATTTTSSTTTGTGCAYRPKMISFFFWPPLVPQYYYWLPPRSVSNIISEDFFCCARFCKGENPDFVEFLQVLCSCFGSVQFLQGWILAFFHIFWKQASKNFRKNFPDKFLRFFAFIKKYFSDSF